MQDENELISTVLPPPVCLLLSEMETMRRRESTRIKLRAIAILLLHLVIIIFSFNFPRAKTLFVSNLSVVRTLRELAELRVYSNFPKHLECTYRARNTP